MRKWTVLISSVTAASLCSLALLVATTAGAASDDQALLDKAKSLFKPLPDSSALENTALTPDRVALGKALFFETRVSSDGRQGCGSCHNPAYHGGDSLPLSFSEGYKMLALSLVVLYVVVMYGLFGSLWPPQVIDMYHKKSRLQKRYSELFDSRNNLLFHIA